MRHAKMESVHWTRRLAREEEDEMMHVKMSCRPMRGDRGTGGQGVKPGVSAGRRDRGG